MKEIISPDLQSEKVVVHRLYVITKNVQNGPPEAVDALPYSVKYGENGLRYTTMDGWDVFRPWHSICEVEGKLMEIEEGEGAYDDRPDIESKDE